ncbi:MAG TPA: hypothetical protein VHX86_04155 [Tepidisphaeraceae bacterium]|jgi:hypothetical protein|nr:hypothetical protein [Tepidisphaeraceae bacterium]
MKLKISGILRGVNIASVAVLAAGITGFNNSANASVLLPGQSAPTLGTGAFAGTADSPVLGPSAFTGLQAPFNNVVFTGTITSQVLKDSTTGGLDFVYHFANSDNSADGIQRLSVQGFAGFTVDADYIPGTGAAFPATVNLDATGDIVGFTFSAAAPVAPGLTADDLVVKTDASAYTLGDASLQDGGNGNVVVYVPAVPEPVSAALAAFGFSALALRRRRNNA